MDNAQNLGFGLGLRAPHYDQFLQERPKSADWLEIISDNYISAHGGYTAMLEDLRRDYPIIMHGVSLSIGSTDPLDEDYVVSLKQLADRLEASFVSDHLCFTGVNGEMSHDLLPIPYTQEALAHVTQRVHRVQDLLGRSFVFENASTYVAFDGEVMSEPEFLNALYKSTGCGILMDINNVYVCAQNHGWDAKAYIDALPGEAIRQYHLAGHTVRDDMLIDTHDGPVSDPVWELYRYALKVHGARSTMVEWDESIPAFDVLEHEVNLARKMTEETLRENAA